MLKTCFLHTSFPNYYNKTCGEIICQTETTFTITCKLCAIKIFHFDEFVEHFHKVHWAEICGGGAEKCENKLEKKVEDTVLKKDESDLLFQNEKQDQNDEHIENCAASVDVKNQESEVEESASCDSDSEDLAKPVTILKKDVNRTSSNEQEKYFECVQCSRKFTTKFYLRFHMRQQHEPKNFKCEKCSKSFVEKRYLILHQRSHTGYTCQICQKVFEKYEALRYHGESHIETRNFLCDFENCGKAFPNNRRLSAHKRSHFIQPSFVCEICGSRQRSKEFLIVHIRTHTGEKPYACKQCDRKFASKHFLQDHQSVHATERSHVCTVCGKAFASSKSLYHHRHLHSGIKKFVCKICNSAYSQAAGLSAHIRKHKQESGLLE